MSFAIPLSSNAMSKTKTKITQDSRVVSRRLEIKSETLVTQPKDKNPAKKIKSQDHDALVRSEMLHEL